ncbi:unnamed protein product [Peniophora sp. CBMAI 1063]|nr:unnamed protein product [Peniophora sp. CBMAI 1063]
MVRSYLAALASVLVGALASHAAVIVPPELATFTGLSEVELLHLLQPRDAEASCPSTANFTGIFSGPGKPSRVEVLKRNSFVKRSGTKLKLAGEPFKPVGANIYWLGLDENVIPDPSYPSQTRVLEVLADVAVMGGNAVRGHTLGVSFGNPLSVEPSLDEFNDAAYKSIDFAIAAARLYGIKLLIPLVDNYNYYHGGKYQFIGWHGINFTGTGADIVPADVGAFFYNTTAIVDSFKRYITHHLNHVNQYTGIALKDDPTIMAWESGNELAAIRFGDGPAPPAWTKEIGEHVKSIAPDQLFMDGSYGVFPETLGNEVVDIFGDHFYPPNITRLSSGIEAVEQAGRVYFAGEYDWTGVNGGNDLTSFLGAVEASQSAGDFYWSLFGHDDACCQYVEHDDGFAFYYLRGNDTDLYVQRGDILIDHAARMTGVKAPKAPRKVACPQNIGQASPGFGL